MTSAIKEKAHTAGPWTTGKDVLVRGHNEIGLSLAFVNCEPGSKTDIEARANARLIAAAPDLLEALSELLKIRSGRTVKAARAAIDRATGEAK